jgi:hypothetical protein
MVLLILPSLLLSLPLLFKPPAVPNILFDFMCAFVFAFACDPRGFDFGLAGDGMILLQVKLEEASTSTFSQLVIFAFQCEGASRIFPPALALAPSSA